MEVKELVGDIELTEEQKALKEKQENKENFKAIQKYILSDDYKKLLWYGKEKADNLVKDIERELKTRKKAELIYSEVDDLVEYNKFLADVLKQIDNSEWWIVLKNEILKEIETVNSNIYIKVDKDNFFDAPRFTKLDAIKTKRNLYMTIDMKISTYSNRYAEIEEQEQEDKHPY